MPRPFMPVGPMLYLYRLFLLPCSTVEMVLECGIWEGDGGGAWRMGGGGHSHKPSATVLESHSFLEVSMILWN